jgi:hypothetical protein
MALIETTSIDQIEITGLNGKRFSAGGDSGSLIIEQRTNKAVGLLFAGNGTNGFADTKFNANTNQTVNNFALSVYLRTANTNATVDMGNANSPTFLPLTSIEGSAIGRTQYCWDFTTSKVDIATADSRGMWGVSRTGATTWQSFQRNSAVAKTTTTSQTTLPNLNIYVGASNINTGASAFSNREVSFAQLSNGLTNSEFNNLYTRVQAFQTSLSRQV